MPFFRADLVHVACKGDLENSKEARQEAVAVLFSPEKRDVHAEMLLIEFLRGLPLPEEQTKILRKLEELTVAHGGTIGNFLWWDIMKGEHWLFADVRRDGRDHTVSFSWKTVEKGGSKATAPNQQYASWVRDVKLPCGWRYEFNQPEYHTLIAAFTYWLHRPLPPFPW